LTARLGATTTYIGALLHRRAAVWYLFALVGATGADFRARATSEFMQMAAANHKVRARLADVRAVEQQSDMFRRSVFTSHLKTVRDGLQTNAMTIGAVLNALLYVV